MTRHHKNAKQKVKEDLSNVLRSKVNLVYIMANGIMIQIRGMVREGSSIQIIPFQKAGGNRTNLFMEGLP